LNHTLPEKHNNDIGTRLRNKVGLWSLRFLNVQVARLFDSQCLLSLTMKEL
jgi:hypothetical protein